MEPKAPGALCSACPLKSMPFVPGCGSMSADAVIMVGEAPGFEEVRKGEPFVGPSGLLMNAIINNIGHDSSEVYRTNVVACRPPGNKLDEYPEAIYFCKERLLRELDDHPAKKVIALGKVAAETLIPGYSPDERGMWHVWKDKQVLPSWHPAYVLRKPGEVNALQRDVRVVFEGYKKPRFTHAPAVTVVRDVSHLRELLSRVPEGAWVAYDIETDQVEWYDRPGKKADAVLCLMLSWDDEWGIVLDDALLYDTPGTIPTLQEFFNRKDTILCAQNSQFDRVFLQSHFGLCVRCDFDTMLAHYVLDENTKHGLKLLAKEEFGIPDYEVALIKEYLRSQNDRYSKIPFDKLAQYGLWDVVVTRALAQIFYERLRLEGLLDKPFRDVLMPGQSLAVKMELRGLAVDAEYITKANLAMQAEQDRIAEEARRLVGRPVLNLNSPQQLSDVIWNQLRMPQPKSYKIKPGSTAHDAIEPLKGKHPFIDALIYYRRVAKLRSSYLENMLEFIDVNGRVHPEMLLHGTEVGRVAVRNPAAQTIPRPAKSTEPGYNPYMDGAVIRGAITCDPGNKLLVVDYSQAELRVAAAMSGEPFLLEAYRRDEDLHTKVAIGMFGSDYTKEQRVRCKMFNFSYLYGGSEYSFATDAGLPVDVARAFVRDYNQLMPVLASFRVSQYEKLKNDGYVSSVFNRRRRFPLIVESNQDDARKAAVHAPVAGTASDLTLLSGIQAEKDGIDVVMLVHDSILAEAPEDQSAEQVQHIAEVMRKTGETYLESVPWKVDPEIRSRWAEPPNLWQIGIKYTSAVSIDR
jgi:uracil-DNA glycosylase family 4